MDIDITTDGELARVFERGTGSFLPERAVDAGLELMVALSVLAIPECAEAGFLLFDDDGHRVCRACSGPRAATIGATQDALDEGPPIDAGTRREVVRSDDLTSDPRWRRLAAVAQDVDLRASLAVPVVAGEDVLGTFDLYADSPRAFEERTDQLVHLVAAQAALATPTPGNAQSEADAIVAALRPVVLSAPASSQATSGNLVAPAPVLPPLGVPAAAIGATLSTTSSAIQMG